MIQRIQTVWLSITLLAALLLIKGSIIAFSAQGNETMTLGYDGFAKVTGNVPEILRSSAGIKVLLLLISSLSFVSIFLFRWRRLQKKAILVVFSFSLCLIFVLAYYYQVAVSDASLSIAKWIKLPLLIVMPITSWLAYKGVQRDEKLVNSYDRLR
ncbi:MAG: DUF4293 family protein [Bacteroidales bacterium]